MSLTVGIDYTPAYQQSGGIGRYVRELVTALARVDHDSAYRLFVAGASHTLPILPGSNFDWRPTRLSPRWLARIWHRAHIPYPVERWTGAIDLFHATDFVLPPVRSTTRTLLTIHDLSFVHVPETASPALKRYLDTVVPASVRRADRILADSQATRNDLMAIYDTPPDKIEVLLSGVDQHFCPVADEQRIAAVRATYGLGGWPFLFTVGTVQPRKNYHRLCLALQLLKEDYPDLHLVIAGGKGWLEDPIYATVEQLGLSDSVHFIGFAADADLPALYSAAEAVPYVSLYEGFGLVVLEAMACGTPVVASNLSSIPEVAGDAALLVDPYDSAAIAEALHSTLSDTALREQLVTKGYKQAASFTWDSAARQLAAIYREMLDPTDGSGRL